MRQKAQWQLHIQEFHERERYRPAGCYGVMSPSKWLAHPEIVRCVKDRDFRNIRPITAQIAPTLRCTNRCPICSYGKRKSGPFRDMTLEDMTSAVTALRGAGVKGIIFTGGGEPLCNDATIRGMRQARQVGLSVGLFTNGQLLREDVCEELAGEVEPSFVRVSINGWNAEAYSLVHGVAGTAYGLDRVLANLNSLARKKLEHKATFKLDIGILISPLVLDNLLDSAFEVKRLAFKYPGAINNVTYRPAISYIGGCWDDDNVERCVDYLSRSQMPLVRRLGKVFPYFIRDQRQFPPVLFDKALEIINSQVLPVLTAHENVAHRVSVGVPAKRFRHARQKPSGDATRRCLACPLVVFVGPDTSLYHCVELALDPALSYGRLVKVQGIGEFRTVWDGTERADLVAQFSAATSADCPPVCLLHECNEAFDWIDSRLAAGGEEKMRVLHEIDVAREYFSKYVEPNLGEAVNFI